MYKTVKWKRRMPKNIITDAEVKLTGYLSERKYPGHSDSSDITMKITVSSFFRRMQSSFPHWMLPIFIRKMVDRAVLQMAQAASQDKEILGYNRERCSHTNQCGYYHIQSCGYCPT